MAYSTFDNRLHLYNTEDSLPYFRSHFNNTNLQIGGTLEFWKPYQRGGNPISKAMKNLFLPLLKNVGRKALAQTRKSAINFGADIVQGKSVKNSLKNRSLELAKNTLAEAFGGSPVNTTTKKSARQKKRVTSRKVTKRRTPKTKTKASRARDIFN